MTTSPTAQAPSGSVQRYAQMIREVAGSDHETYVCAEAHIQVLCDSPLYDADEKVERVLNVLAAAELVRQELTDR